jgi:hypothetical protein
MHIQPELGRRLAQAKLEEARSRAQRGLALRAASPNGRTPAPTAGTPGFEWAAPMLATVSRWRGPRTSPRPDARCTTNG